MPGSTEIFIFRPQPCVWRKLGDTEARGSNTFSKRRGTFHILLSTQKVLPVQWEMKQNSLLCKFYGSSEHISTQPQK